ncbi:monocarboxylate transporter 14-like [Corticium candelabrum]|uniref:monocarboxylate transporter 14-like n=1 Tax=Corticium candelabrum TaxID=121492 RepID=UPI002E258614|nr:monocarboxylate transporter 14-like [Corticium candelabrum]XP_062511081.1 monocarboxylate transporter 14-like [Corticium candelabrum]
MGGLGGSMMYSPTVGSLPAYFRKRKSLAVCLARSGSWFGNLAFVSCMTVIRDEFGWRMQCVFLGCIGSLTIFMGALYRPRPVQPASARPSVKEIVVQSCNSQRHRRFAVWVWIHSLHFFQLYLVLFHLVRHARCMLGVDSTASSLLLVYLSAAAACCSISNGILQDKVKNKILILQFVIFVGGVANLSFRFLTTYRHLIVYSILIGIGDSFLSAMCVIPQELVGSKEAVNAFGILSFSGGLVSCFGGPAGGWAFDATGSYDVVFTIAGGFSVVSCLLMFCVSCSTKTKSEMVTEASKNEPKSSPAAEVVGSVETSV